jgi:hypothetical protein
MRTKLMVAAGIGLALTTITAASATTGSVTGPSGATYTYTTTCATQSMTANVDMNPAAGFTGLVVENNIGGVDHSDIGIPSDASNNPISITHTNWKASAYYGERGSTGFRLSEGFPTPTVIAGPISMSTCPDYARSPGSFFTPLTPKRILDTRPASAVNYTGAKPAAGGLVTITVAGTAGVPADAVAVALNVTATEATLPGYVQVFPTGRATPGSSSNLNTSAAGQTIANSVIVPLGDGGAVSLFTQTGAHLLVDVAGYFLSTTSDVAAGRYKAIAPTRVLDTRPGAPIGYTGAKPGAKATVTATVAGRPGLPAVADVSAVVLNVTATEATGPGFVQVAASGDLAPGASSSLNVERANETIPNMVIVPVSTSGKVDLYTQSGTHLLVDVLGWFSNSTVPAGNDGLFVPMTPERVLDTRPGSAVNFSASNRLGVDQNKPSAKETVSIHFDGLPLDAGAVVLNLTATDATAPGFVQTAAKDSLVPGASSNLNLEKAGQTIPNGAIVPTDDIDYGIDIYTQNGTHLITDIAGFFTDPSRVPA